MNIETENQDNMNDIRVLRSRSDGYEKVPIPFTQVKPSVLVSLVELEWAADAVSHMYFSLLYLIFTMPLLIEFYFCYNPKLSLLVFYLIFIAYVGQWWIVSR